jgi:predicted small lipoprotein YifL
MLAARFILIVAAFFLLAGCGKKGALIPPEALVPAAVNDLKARQQGDEIVITWTQPQKEKSGRPLKDLSSMEITRMVVTGGSADCSACPESWEKVAELYPDYPGKALKTGGLYILRDGAGEVGRKAEYRLVSRSKSGGVSQSATTRLMTTEAAGDAPQLTAEVLPSAVRLFVKSATPAGFNIYRRESKNQPATLPLNDEPVKGLFWEDSGVTFGKSYLYRATVLELKGGELVESPFSKETEILFQLQEIR